jgi:hypothetical protein
MAELIIGAVGLVALENTVRIPRSQTYRVED